ncbi:Mitochondrial solute carrier protein [Phaffia rhodozyma]|uniref:Mitochondrial solute carrier protein n=1 Tax=Phaffia rhodozyma TaxID=264483 RepID=A0A0F7SL78_PHARH|nr:Mitochondrial solute carrier protein [Phaffia rhodozyma]
MVSFFSSSSSSSPSSSEYNNSNLPEHRYSSDRYPVVDTSLTPIDDPAELEIIDLDEPVENDSNWQNLLLNKQHLMEYFIAGGLAGATSRTVVSPLERLKIIMQVQSAHTGQPYKGVFASLVKMYREEGFRGYMKGNGINCLRIMPYSAVQFSTYETLKVLLATDVDGSDQGQLGTGMKLFAGSLAGIASVALTFPLDLVRARLSISAAQLHGSDLEAAKLRGKELGIMSMTRKVYREEGGVRGLYRGCLATAAGVAPYVALNFVLYEKFRLYWLPKSEEDSTNGGKVALIKLACGAAAGGLSQTVTFPFDLLRRKMQVIGLEQSRRAALAPSVSPSPSFSSSFAMASSTPSSTSISTPISSVSTSVPKLDSLRPAAKHAYTYSSGTGAMIQIFKHEGIRGLYRGIWPNLLKVAPSMGVSFFTYETCLKLMHEP